MEALQNLEALAVRNPDDALMDRNRDSILSEGWDLQPSSLAERARWFSRI
jgi:hypothetical protein